MVERPRQALKILLIRQIEWVTQFTCLSEENSGPNYARIRLSTPNVFRRPRRMCCPAFGVVPEPSLTATGCARLCGDGLG